MFLICKNGKNTTNPSMILLTLEDEICLWNLEEEAINYLAKRQIKNWKVREATSEDFSMVGKMKRNRTKFFKTCHKVIS